MRAKKTEVPMRFEEGESYDRFMQGKIDVGWEARSDEDIEDEREKTSAIKL